MLNRGEVQSEIDQRDYVHSNTTEWHGNQVFFPFDITSIIHVKKNEVCS